jgi:transposase-like protein
LTPASISDYEFSNRTNATLFVPAGCKPVYEAANYWKDFKQIVEGGSYTVKARSTVQEEREAIVKDCIDNGLSYSEAAVKYQVSYQQVRNWVLRYKEKGKAGLEDRRGRRKKDQTPRTREEELDVIRQNC